MMLTIALRFAAAFTSQYLWAKTMRCPKCGYLSFDHLEICRGCRKNIAKFSQELSGIVFLCELPDFLQFKTKEESRKTEDGTALINTEQSESIDDFGAEPEDAAGFSADVDAVEFALPDMPKTEEESKEIEFELPGGATKEQVEEIAFDMSDEEETLPLGKNEIPVPAADEGLELSFDESGELDIGLEDDAIATNAVPEPPAKVKSGRQQNDIPSIDLGGLDLFGDHGGKENSFSIGALELEHSEPTGKKEEKEYDGKPGKRGAVADTAKKGLPDLDLGLEGINFTPPAPTSAGSTPTSKKLKPAAKTGTALDDFDFDLGELVTATAEKPTKIASAKTALGKPALVSPGQKIKKS